MAAFEGRPTARQLLGGPAINELQKNSGQVMCSSAKLGAGSEDSRKDGRVSGAEWGSFSCERGNLSASDRWPSGVNM